MAAIREHWAPLSSDFDPGEWRAHHPIVDVHGDRAYALAVYTETLVPRRGGAALSVSGRVVLFLRRDEDGA